MLHRSLRRSGTAAASEVSPSVNLAAVRRGTKPGVHQMGNLSFQLNHYHKADEPNFRSEPWHEAAYRPDGGLDPWAPFPFAYPLRHTETPIPGIWFAMGQQAPPMSKYWGPGCWRLHYKLLGVGWVGCLTAMGYYYYQMGYKNKWATANVSAIAGA